MLWQHQASPTWPTAPYGVARPQGRSAAGVDLAEPRRSPHQRQPPMVKLQAFAIYAFDDSTPRTASMCWALLTLYRQWTRHKLQPIQDNVLDRSDESMGSGRVQGCFAAIRLTTDNGHNLDTQHALAGQVLPGLLHLVPCLRRPLPQAPPMLIRHNRVTIPVSTTVTPTRAGSYQGQQPSNSTDTTSRNTHSPAQPPAWPGRVKAMRHPQRRQCRLCRSRSSSGS